MKALLILAPALLMGACQTTPQQSDYGQDMLQPNDYGDDALPSELSIAFERADARYGYSDARIEYDARGCAFYQGTDKAGDVQREMLETAKGKAICPGR